LENSLAASAHVLFRLPKANGGGFLVTVNWPRLLQDTAAAGQSGASSKIC